MRISHGSLVLLPAVAGMLALGATIAAAVPGNNGPTSPYRSLYNASSPIGSLDRETARITNGVRFSASVPGYVDSVEFYRPSVSTARTVNLWSSSGNKLATGTAPSTGSGWVAGRFAQPIHIRPNVTYVASVSTPNRYESKAHGFDKARTVGPLSVPACGGVYAYGSQPTFPSNRWECEELFVSPWFVADAGAQPTVTRTVTVTAAPPSSPPSGEPTPPPSASPPTPPSTWSCVTASPTGNCGAYSYSQITNSNGYNTYISNNCWADPACKQTVSANSPGEWQVVSTEPAGNTAVKTYPDVQQLFNDWCGNGSWNACQNPTDTPISDLSKLTSSYTETTPHASATIGQFAWDIWLSNTSGPNEIMVWVDNANRGNGGADQIGTATIGGQAWTLYEYGGGEIIWSLGAPGTFAQQGSGTVDLLGLLHDLQNRGLVPAGARIGQIDAGWEICSTGGGPETFSVSRYTLAAA